MSPSSRDVVLASYATPSVYAKKLLTNLDKAGRSIYIDLDNPLSIPQFLPQGGIWEIADVQWNPHPSWSEYIISTSSEKLYVYILNLPHC